MEAIVTPYFFSIHEQARWLGVGNVKVDAELWQVTVSTWFQLLSRDGKRRGGRGRNK
jgi:hypothetical protein